MTFARRLGWAVTGFAASAVAMAAFGPHPAQAQGQGQPGASNRSQGPTAPSRGQRAEPIVDETDAAPDIAGAIPSDDPSQDPVEDDGNEPRPRAGQRTIIRDGDLTIPGEPPVLRDGIVDVGEPEAPQDGVDPSVIDTRPPEDIAVFENPPAGFDPLLFQTEGTEPLEDRRTRRLFTIEPFDPIGIPIGSFVLFPEVELGASAFNNVFRSPAARSDTAFDVRPSARLASNWRAHALEFRTTGTLSYFNEFDSENEQGYLVEARGRLDVTRRTNLQATLSRELTQESRSAIDASSVGDRADLTTDRATMALQHRFNRLTLQLRGSVTDQQYGNVQTGNVLQRNDDRDVKTYEEALRATWELKPALFLFSEVAINQREYERAAQTDNIRRDSKGERYRVGLGFGNTGQILRGEISLGYGVQRPDDPRLSDISGILIDSTLAWRMSELTSLLFSARSDVTETTTAGSGGVFTHQAGVEARHAFRRHLIGSAGLSYTVQDIEGANIDETEWRATLGVEYFLNREAVLFGRYAHTVFSSTEPNTDYTSDEIRLGLRLRR